jgi:predicted transcriptional regulator
MVTQVLLSKEFIMNSERLRIIQSLSTTNKSVDVNELVNISGLSRGKVLGHLPRLCIDGLVDKQGRRYAITQKGSTIIREINPIEENQSFHFFLNESVATDFIARNLKDFFEIVQVIDVASLEFHTHRDDFSKWVKEVYNDEELAAAIAELAHTHFTGDLLRAKLGERLAHNYKLLKTFLT